jgi:hypothetical protein
VRIPKTSACSRMPLHEVTVDEPRPAVAEWTDLLDLRNAECRGIERMLV